MPKVLEKTTTYFGPLTDSSRWQNFKHRQDDIFICTPPKCGTTWTQAIIAMLVFGKVDHGLKPGLISPWIDALCECYKFIKKFFSVSNMNVFSRV